MLNKHPSFVNLEPRKDYQEVLTYHFCEEKIQRFKDVDESFNYLVRTIDELQKQGYKMKSIYRNRYTLEKEGVEYRITIDRLNGKESQ